MSDPAKGSRKLTESRETACILLVGFGAAAYFKTDPQLFGMFALAVMGKSAGFMWGNAKEHQAAAQATPAAA